MLPKPPSPQEIIHMIHAAKEVGKISLEAGRKLLEWMREENARAAASATMYQQVAEFIAAQQEALATLAPSSADRESASFWVAENRDPLLSFLIRSSVAGKRQCLGRTRLGLRCERKPPIGGAFCRSHDFDGRCHGLTASRERCRRRTAMYACQTHWKQVTDIAWPRNESPSHPTERPGDRLA
jgi:hypothetical protein